MESSNDTQPKQLVTTIDVVKEFKRQGKFDLLRKQLLAEYSNSPKGQELLEKLSSMDLKDDFMKRLSNLPVFKTLDREILVLSQERENQINADLQAILEQLKSRE